MKRYEAAAFVTVWALDEADAEEKLRVWERVGNEQGTPLPDVSVSLDDGPLELIDDDSDNDEEEEL